MPMPLLITFSAMIILMSAPTLITVRIPIIASGGADSPSHMADALNVGASAVLAASIFHENDTTCRQVKTALRGMGIEVRL